MANKTAFFQWIPSLAEKKYAMCNQMEMSKIRE